MRHPGGRSRAGRPAGAAALLIVVGLLAAACTSAVGTPTRTVTRTATDTPSVSAPTSSAAVSSSSKPKPPPSPPASPVHIKLFNLDGSTYGVGMPVIAFFSKQITSAKALQAATTVTINGKPAHGAWYFEYSSYLPGYPIEGHFRLESFWPAHSHVHVDIPANGLSAGRGLAFNDSLTSDWYTGAAHIGVVNDHTHKLTITDDGKYYGTFPVSLGEHNNPTMRTYRGTKVIMEQVPTVCMHNTENTYYECGIKYDQRLTYSGEYLHSAPWNVYNIDHGIDSSNGCTNLLPADAIKLYHFLRVGDVVKYPNADGPMMPMGMGYGDWNVSWSTWLTGGLVPTT